MGLQPKCIVFQAVHAGNMAVGDDRRGPQQLLWNFDSSKETQVSSGGHSSMGLVLHSIGSSFGTPTSTENPRIYGLPVHYHQVPLWLRRPGLGVLWLGIPQTGCIVKRP